MEYFKFTTSFLNTLTLETSSYSELDTFLNGVVKNFLNHNYSFLDVAPTQSELTELKEEIEASYSLMLGDVKPRYEEVVRLGTQQLFESTDEVVSEYGSETNTGSYYEPKVNDTQTQINTTGSVTSYDDDTTTTTKTEYRVLSESAIKDFFKEIKEEVEFYFIDYVNTYVDGVECRGKEFSQAQLDAINSGIDTTKVAQIQTNKENIVALGEALTDAYNTLNNNKVDKTSGLKKVYATDASGNQTTITYEESAFTNTIAKRDSNGNIGVGTPTADEHATRKGWVDQQLGFKQNTLSATQLDAVNSGIDATKVGQIATNTTNIGTNAGDISTINSKIPSQASASNQLADKNFVNSSVATNTANFVGTFNSVADLEAYSGPLTNNDYAFVVSTDLQGNTVYNRYKYNSTTQTWSFEYALNNSSFTSNQWSAINSGATSTNIGQIATNTTNIGTKADKATTIAGVDLQDNITKSEMLTALNVEDGAEVNVQADWSQADNTKDDYIKNKPTLHAVGEVFETMDSAFDPNVTFGGNWTLIGRKDTICEDTFSTATNPNNPNLHFDYIRRNGFVTINVYSYGTQTLAGGAYNFMGTLPVGYRPAQDVKFSMSFIGGAYVQNNAEIDTQGTFEIYVASIVNYFGVTATFPIPVDSNFGYVWRKTA